MCATTYFDGPRDKAIVLELIEYLLLRDNLCEDDSDSRMHTSSSLFLVPLARMSTTTILTSWACMCNIDENLSAN